MSGTVFLLDKDTKEPVKENGAVNFTVVNSENGEVEFDSKYIMGIALKQVIILTKE